MKRTFLYLATAVALTFIVASCGKKKPTLLTPEQVQLKVDSIYTAQSAELEPDLDQLCDTRFETYISEAVDTLLAAKNAVQ